MSSTPPAGDSPPQRSSRANALVIVLGSGLLLAALGVVIHVLTTRARDAVVDGDFIELATPISGQLMELKVEAGTAVRKGQPLAMVQNPRASDADVRQLRTALTTAEARLEQVEQEFRLQSELAAAFQRDANNQQKLETARSSNDLDQLKADLARERQELAFSQRDVKRQEELFRVGAVSETWSTAPEQRWSRTATRSAASKPTSAPRPTACRPPSATSTWIEPAAAPIPCPGCRSQR